MPVSVVKRVQGRPPKGEGDVGRDRLIEAVRRLLRTPAPPEISRKAVADAAGVTPALVTYYFPDKHSLVEAATRPLIRQRINQLLAIIDGPREPNDKLREVVALFVGLNETAAHLIDYTIELCRQDMADPAQRKLLTTTYQRLRAFYLAGVADGTWREFDGDVFLLALWGMCKFVAEAFPPESAQAHPAAEPSADPRVDAILDLMLNGLRPR